MTPESTTGNIIANIRLPVRPRAYKGEAVIGFLARVAYANGYESHKQLWLVLKTVEKLVNSLMVSEVEVHSLFGLFPSYWGSHNETFGLAVPDFNHANLRWCPLCLLESRHLRGMWLVKLYCVCTRHHIHLQDKCPSCGSTQGLGHPHAGLCECGAKLYNGKVKKADPALVTLTLALEASISGQATSCGLPSLLAPEWIRLATYLGQFSANFQPARPGRVCNLHQLDVATALMSGLASLVNDWPENFHNLLMAIHGQAKTGLSLQRTFGSLYRVLYRQFKEPSFQFLRDVFEDYVHQNWDGFICKRNKSFKANTICSHPQLTLKQAAKKAGSEVSTIRHLMKAELISVRQSQLVSGRTNCSINRNNVDKIVTLTKNTVVLDVAAKMLALPKRRVRLLIQAGIIKTLVCRKQVNAAIWQIPIVQLSTLWFKPAPMLADEKYLSMVSILKHWRLTTAEFISLVETLLSQEIIAFAKQTQTTAIGKIQLRKIQFTQWLNSYRYEHSKSLTVDSAAKELKIKQQVAYDLVKKGLLPALSNTIKGYRISPEQLQDFRRSYVSLAHLAERTGSSPRKLLQHINTTPITGPGIDGSRQYFYRIADLPSELMVLSRNWE